MEQLAFFLGGVVITGFSMMLRGDFLGAKAAADVEMRINVRLDREMGAIQSDLKEIKESIRDLRN